MNDSIRSRWTSSVSCPLTTCSAAAAEHVVNGQLTDDVHRDLIEGFIQKVGASQGATA